MRSARRRTDLVVFLAVLVTGVVLVLSGIQPEAVSTVAIGLSTLYAAWQRQEGPPRREEARPPAPPAPAEGGSAPGRASE
ncbi:MULTISPECIES: hypothetical protein [Streptomyces]|uniref:hypothetical protein n=1 Tax=Streptomyces TaxID=1883 RepID=UPI000B8C46D4|nr:hypothetical protein [Streptomyces sp. XY006]OXS32822.1 hypothetical protein CHR28_24345 [Streptomyces sp. XY006]